MEEFDTVFRVDYESNPLTLVRHKRTGMHVAVANCKSPTVNGYFVVHTEAFTDYGEPHTLEHLCFMGSKKYPYKGVLDLLANKCLAQGTNAWTDIDHTAYTVETAGSEGFLNLMPIYIDHLLFPTLTDEAFTTEIHHIDEKGEDAGVVYCEMQARENEMGDIMAYESHLMCFPDPKCSYRSETGGRLKELRSLTNQMIKDYHADYYRCDNMLMIVTGQIELTDVCKKMKEVLSRVDSKCSAAKPMVERPFERPFEQFKESAYKELLFPSEDESCGGEIELSWFGKPWSDLESDVAMKLLLLYLTKDSVAPLRKEYVDSSTPLAADVGYSVEETNVPLYTLSLRQLNVDNFKKKPKGDKNWSIQKELIEFLKNHEIDMDRMADIIAFKRTKHMEKLENDPHVFFSDVLISEFLYGPAFSKKDKGRKTPDSLMSLMNLAKHCDEKFSKWTKDQWQELLKKMICDQPNICLVGLPSKKRGLELQEEDKKRLEAQKKELGEEGIKAEVAKRDAAEAENEKPVPDEIMDEVAIPDIGKVQLIPCSTVFDPDAQNTRILTQFDIVDGAQFACIDLLFVIPRAVDKEILKIAPLWCEIAFEVSLRKSTRGPLMKSDEVVKKCTSLFTSKICNLSTAGNTMVDTKFRFGSLACNAMVWSVKCLKADVEEAMLFLQRLKEDAIMDASKIKAGSQRLLNQIPDMKRRGHLLVGFIGQSLLFDGDNLRQYCSWPYLDKTLKQKKNTSDIISGFVMLREVLATCCIHIGGDVDTKKIGTLINDNFNYRTLESWNQLLCYKQEYVRAPQRCELLRKPTTPGCVGLLLPTATSDSNYVQVLLSCPIPSSEHEDYPALILALECLTALEGPFWKKIRGKGLAYSYGLRLSTTAEMLTFTLYRSNNPLQAMEEAGKIVLGSLMN